MSGRRSTKTKDQRIEDLKKAVNRSGFTGIETVVILTDWLGWQRVEITVSQSIHMQIEPGQKL